VVGLTTRPVPLAGSPNGAGSPGKPRGGTMQQYIMRRLLMLIPTLMGVSIIVFAIMRVVPGDVARMILSGGDSAASEEAVQQLREDMGLNRPLVVQYGDWLWDMVRLNPGKSLFTNDPIIDQIQARFPVTLELALGAVIVALVIAIPVGVLSALYQDTWVDYVFRVVSVAGLSVPTFWLGVLTILVLSTYFNWVPPLGYSYLWDDPGRNLQQMVWPMLILGYWYSAVVSRMTRSTMLEVLREDYVRTARAKGLRGRVVVVRHALRNALLPVITIAALQFGHLLGGSVITESIFALPGIGTYLVDAILHRDIPVTQALIVLSAAVYVILNLLVDLTYAWLDPRIRYS
jgi:peptide/nickel transport system permease protein